MLKDYSCYKLDFRYLKNYKINDDGTVSRQCFRCKEWKDFDSAFPWKSKEHTHKQSSCKACCALKREERRKRDPEKYKNRIRNIRLKRKFNISLDIFNKMVQEQNNSCFICGCKNPYKNMDVDHNHSTGLVRKLLCNNCNSGIGHLRENYEILFKSIWYLYIHEYNLNLTFEQFVEQGYITKMLGEL